MPFAFALDRTLNLHIDVRFKEIERLVQEHTPDQAAGILSGNLIRTIEIIEAKVLSRFEGSLMIDYVTCLLKKVCAVIGPFVSQHGVQVIFLHGRHTFRILFCLTYVTAF